VKRTFANNAFRFVIFPTAIVSATVLLNALVEPGGSSVLRLCGGTAVFVGAWMLLHGALALAARVVPPTTVRPPEHD